MKIGIIPDGNRKYSKIKNITLDESYIHGAKIAFEIVQKAVERRDVSMIVFYLLMF